MITFNDCSALPFFCVMFWLQLTGIEATTPQPLAPQFAGKAVIFDFEVKQQQGYQMNNLTVSKWWRLRTLLAMCQTFAL